MRKILEVLVRCVYIMAKITKMFNYALVRDMCCQNDPDLQENIRDLQVMQIIREPFLFH